MIYGLSLRVLKIQDEAIFQMIIKSEITSPPLVDRDDSAVNHHPQEVFLLSPELLNF